mgnify:CR=1 FL=1
MNDNDLKNQDTEISAYRKALREIDWYLRSKRPVIYLTTPEELRIEEGISFICNHRTLLRGANSHLSFN